MPPEIRDNPLPTFSNSKDRLTFLLAEYRVPISITMLAVGVWLAWAAPQIPDPPDQWLQFSAAWALLAIPCFFVGKRIVSWLYNPNLVNVIVATGGDVRRYTAEQVPPAIWDSATVEGPAPLPAEEGWADFVVTDYEWLDDVKELRVRGCERSMLEPGEVLASEAKVDAYYDHYVGVRNAFANLQARVQEFVQMAHDDALAQAIKTRDKALAPGVSAQDKIREAEKSGGLSDDLPTLEELGDWELELPDEPDPPTPRTNGHQEGPDDG